HFFVVFTTSPTPSLYPPSLHDALPILTGVLVQHAVAIEEGGRSFQDPRHQALGAVEILRRADIDERRLDHAALDQSFLGQDRQQDRKSTRLNSSHLGISYAVFCLKKKK